VDKRALRDDVLAMLRRELDALVAAAQSTREGATHEENRPEHDKDTRAIEASYLAGAQAERVEELRRDVAALESLKIRTFEPDAPIALSAIVTVESDGAPSYFFVVPMGGGLRCVRDGKSVQLVTPRSPLGAAVVGKCAGDSVDVVTPQGVRDYEIVDVE
jgi:transcription elongation GreA/GreB family factor